MRLEDICSCTSDRNDLHCLWHVRANARVQHYISQWPIYIQIAWEMDLSWAHMHVKELFAQHKPLEGWPI